MNRAEHWNRIYEDKTETALSWFQHEPLHSLALLDALHVEPHASVVDVGAGVSRFVDALLARGFDDITALDVAGNALDSSRRRLGDRGTDIEWITEDVLEWRPDRRRDVWHDRAVFHFFVDPTDRARYVDVVRSALNVGGHVLLATFALDGPDHCSGLPVTRYDAASLHEIFGPQFEVTETSLEEHRTPAGALQAFQWTAMTRRA